jgi:hypothetical protein
MKYMYMHRKNESTLIKKVQKKKHLAQPVYNDMRRFPKPLQESVFSPALARGWLQQICEKDLHTVQTRARVNEWTWICVNEENAVCEKSRGSYERRSEEHTWYVLFWSFNSEISEEIVFESSHK